MFCYQCEQTAKGEGCTVMGVCGKQPEVAVLQDLLMYCLMGLSQVVMEARRLGIEDKKVGVFTAKSVFSTLTNVNFDPHRFIELIQQCIVLRDQLLDQVEALEQYVQIPEGAATFEPAETKDELIKQAETVGLFSYPSRSSDILSLKHTVLFGIKGVAAYADHAHVLGYENADVYDFLAKGLSSIQRDDLDLDNWLVLALECGKAAYRAMELLDQANTETFGHPVPTKVPIGNKKGKAILVSGHDLKNFEALLKQTRDTGITVYTHGEMLSAHGYPELKKHPHFYGHYGTAWQKQNIDFAEFPGAVLMTSNCLMRPQKAYENNLFTCGMVGWKNIPHIEKRDFKPVINRALALPGFDRDHLEDRVMVGYAKNTLLNLAEHLLDLVKKGNIRHFFLVAGCDGASPGRNYYTEFVEKLPADCMVLTLACGKFRFFDKPLGEIGNSGIPRLLDVGQCNDTYSALQIALALSKALDVDINGLPLSLVLSWYEQKAVCVLLALLYLGIKDIRLGPSLPAFVTPGVLKILQEQFNILPIDTPEQDTQTILSSSAKKYS